MMKLCSRARARTSRRRSRVAVIPVGLHPYYNVSEFNNVQGTSVTGGRLTGTVYKTLGFGFVAGQFSSIVRNLCEQIP